MGVVRKYVEMIKKSFQQRNSDRNYIDLAEFRHKSIRSIVTKQIVYERQKLKHTMLTRVRKAKI